MSSRSSSKSHSFSNVSFPGYFRVGFVKSAHGIRGEVFVQLFAGRADWQTEEFALLLPACGELKIFTADIQRSHKEGLILKLKSVNTRSDSEALRKSQVYIREECLVSPQGESIFLHQIFGFELADPQGRSLGRIEGFSSNGPQDLLEVRTGGGSTALVPFIGEFLVDIDFDKKQVRMDLPPGLLYPEEE